MVMLARLTEDYYFVLSNMMASLCFFPILVVMAIKTESTTDNKERCQITAIFMHFFVMSNCLWMMNLCIQLFLRLRCFIHRHIKARVSYIVTGWIVPLLITCISAYEHIQHYQNGQSCLMTQSSSLLPSVHSLFGLITLVALVLLYSAYTAYRDHLNELRHGEKKIWEKLRAAMMFLVICMVSRAFAFVLATDEGDLATSYVFATAIFIEGSIVFLAFAATNDEVLTAMRVRYFLSDDNNEKVTWSQYECNYQERLDTERQTQEEEYARVQKMDAINSLFTIAQQMDRVKSGKLSNKVGVADMCAQD
ncbi:adhesion G-protein coupled receptor D1-like [Glandiceps talaboti]